MRAALLALFLLSSCARDAAEWRWCSEFCMRRLHVGARGIVVVKSVGYCACELAPDVDWVPSEKGDR